MRWEKKTTKQQGYCYCYVPAVVVMATAASRASSSSAATHEVIVVRFRVGFRGWLRVCCIRLVGVFVMIIVSN
jgi:hypothetical protein